MSNGFDSDQDRLVGPDLGPNCLQLLPANGKVATSNEIVSTIVSYSVRGNTFSLSCSCIVSHIRET